MTDPIGLDFETLPIQQRPEYPPSPVGLAFGFPGMAPFYLAWGHTGGGNNSTESEAKEWAWKAWCAPNPKVFHNAKFDISIAHERWNFPELNYKQFEDTMFLAFLADPHAHDLGLKPLAEEWLNEPPTERDAIAEWVVENAAHLKATYPQIAAEFPPTKKHAGAWIFATPAHIAGPYAIGDITRTLGLWNTISPMINKYGLWTSYERKKKLVAIFSENEREGLPIDQDRLEIDIHLYNNAFDGAEEWLRGQLRSPTLNFDADLDVANALISAGAVLEKNFPRTEPTRKHPSGQLSMSKENLTPDLFEGEWGSQIASVLGYRNRLKTCLTMFMEPWAKQARQTNGTIHTNWNLTRNTDGGGTRTGRPSTSNHNLLNLAKSFLDRDDGYIPPPGLPPLPLVRKYITAGKGRKIIHRDLSQQELRLFAHFEQGELNRQYNENPFLDVHTFVGDEIKRVTQREIERTKIKTLNFQGIYGGGIPALQRKARVSLDEAKQLKKFHNEALPGRQILNDAIKVVIRRGLPIVTWGGRWYFEEKPGKDQRSKLYKLINYLIQGSAADFTEECLIDWYYHPARQARFLVTVYDEINGISDEDIAMQQLELMREVMEAPRLSVPMVSDGKIGDTWGDLQKCPRDQHQIPSALSPQESRAYFLRAS